MRVATCQFASATDAAANTATAVAMIGDAAAAGADCAILPELAMYFDPRGEDGPGPHGQALDGPFATAVADAARSAGITVLAGMLELVGEGERVRGEGTDGEQRDYNTLIAIGPDGELLGTYRKIHLYDAFGFRESDSYLPGPIDRPLAFAVGGVMVGALTCYDLRFPEPFRWVTDAGVQLIAVPSAWIVGPAKERHWSTLLAARAIENTVYVAGAAQTGPVSCGQSQVLDPMGTVIAGAGERPSMAVADIDPARVDEVRRANPSLENRRFSVTPRA